MTTYKLLRGMDIEANFKIKKLWFWIPKKIDIRIRNYFISKENSIIYIVKNIYLNSRSKVYITVEFTNEDLEVFTKDLQLEEYLEIRYGEIKDLTYNINPTYPYIEKSEDGNVTEIIMKDDSVRILTSGSINLNNKIAGLIDIEGGLLKKDIRLSLWYKDMRKLIFIKITESGKILYSDISNMIGSTANIHRYIEGVEE